MYIYICYIHPKLRIANYPSGTGKGAGLLEREHQGSTEGALREYQRSTKECCGAVQGQSQWKPELAA